jgi:cytochrome c oxidase subunit 2
MSLLNFSFFTHQFLLLFCIFITFFVLVTFFYIKFSLSNNTMFLNHFLLEFFWTLFPVLIVLLLFFPLFFYIGNFDFKNDMVYFIVANQWYWDFFFVEPECSSLDWDLNLYSYTSIYLPLLEVINFFFTSNDVIHAFSLPILYIMIDLVPGTIHNLSFNFPFSGIYTVYCAQICGMNHSVMPFYINVYY